MNELPRRSQPLRSLGRRDALRNGREPEAAMLHGETEEANPVIENRHLLSSALRAGRRTRSEGVKYHWPFGPVAPLSVCLTPSPYCFAHLSFLRLWKQMMTVFPKRPTQTSSRPSKNSTRNAGGKDVGPTGSPIATTSMRSSTRDASIRSSKSSRWPPPRSFSGGD